MNFVLRDWCVLKNAIAFAQEQPQRISRLSREFLDRQSFNFGLALSVDPKRRQHQTTGKDNTENAQHGKSSFKGSHLHLPSNQPAKERCGDNGPNPKPRPRARFRAGKSDRAASPIEKQKLPHAQTLAGGRSAGNLPSAEGAKNNYSKCSTSSFTGITILPLCEQKAR